MPDRKTLVESFALMAEPLETFDELRLRRWPRRRNERLRAWDGADRYLLKTLDEVINTTASVDAGTLVVNDQCGALWLAASKRGPAWSSGDSWLARQAALTNAQDNDLVVEESGWLWPGERPLAAPARVLMRVPKDLSLLASQLADLSAWLPEGTPIWLAGMDKHLPPQLVPVMERWLGNGQAGLGWKKARRFQAVAPGAAVRTAPLPGTVTVPERGWSLSAYAGVFGRQHLDIGARFLLKHLPRDVVGNVADLGCGNGVLGLALAADNPSAQVTFCDESFLAVASARTNVRAVLGEAHNHRFHLGNGLDGLEQRFDLILLNPPFHRGHAVDDQAARTLFRHAKRQLVSGGELRVVANRHLDYRRPLEKAFGQVELLAGNAKFVIWRCQ